MMKSKWMLRAVLALVAGAMVSCQKVDQPSEAELLKTGLSGVWELVSVDTKATVGSVTVSVYINFVEGDTFVLHQKIGEGRYTKFDGTYSVGEDKTLSGTYTGGKTWGPYQASLSGSSLTLSTATGTEVDTYQKIDAIPAPVLENLY